MMKAFLVLSIFVALFYPKVMKGQGIGNYSVSKITQNQGLSQGSNYFWHEDDKGFVWLTGNDALNRYDGSSVKTYNLNYFFKNCPTLQQGYGFAEDEKHLYIGSTRGLYIYNYQLDEFTLIDIFKNKFKTKTAIPIGFAKGKIWIFNEDYQLASFDVTSKFVKMEAKIPLERIKSVHIYDSESNPFYFRLPFLDKNQNICFVGKKSLVIYHLDSGKIDFPLKKYWEDSDITFLSSTYDKQQDALYLGTLNDGLFVVNHHYKTIVNHLKTFQDISNIAVTRNWVVLHKRPYLKIFDKNLNLKKVLDKGYERAFGFNFDKIGRLWLCDDGQGQVILDFRGAMLKNNLDTEDSLLLSFKKFGVSSFNKLANQKILINSAVIFDPKTYTAKIFKPAQFGNEYVSRGSNYSYPYSNELWLVKENQGKAYGEVLLFDKNLNLKTKFSFDVAFGKYQSMAILPNSNPLFSFSNGLYFLDLNSKKFKKIDSLPDKNPFFINILSQNRVGISYLNQAMVLVKIESENKYKVIQKILPNVQGFYIQEDKKKQQYWVGTNQGIYLLNKNFKTLKIFDSNNGLAGTYIYGILLDDFGKLWCSHQRGLSSIDTQTHFISNFDKEDGIQHWDFNNRSFMKAEDGTLYFGGVNGFNYFKPPLKFNAFYQPEIYFDEISINNKRYIAPNGLQFLKQIELSHNENNIAIKVLIKDLENGSQRKLLYRIKNQDNTWRKLPKKTPLNLNSLAPGTYVIEFGIEDRFNGSISHQKELTIHIGKAFYQTFLFWAIIGGLIFGGLIFAFSRWKFIQQQNHFKEQLALEAQRNKITADLHDDIGSTLSSLQINSAVAGKMIEKDHIKEAQNVLKNIEHQSQKLSENMSDIVWSLKPNNDALMTLSTRIRNIVSDILGSSDIDYHIEIDEIVNTEITDFSIKKNLILIIKEALNNALKYSKANEITIQFKSIKNEYKLEIKDNGNGFTQENMIGNGIGNMKRRTQEMNGFFEIISENGTCIKISIPKIRD
ncbi:sensor histidine kinase [Chryseobacterium turcicum]|uniref:histidine kinase n=1 Tax=Chryseobacterium turcicum TaxID=2898076 RepID=A0A9Q3V256_9FLAO|nr:sensor histidine kinase [Chryseobacterium turcicum]MCD1116363.1 sensor histidine kinase [Chryseobacterium turcicum]